MNITTNNEVAAALKNSFLVALLQLGIDLNIANILFKNLAPSVELLPVATDGTREFAVTAPPLASMFGCVIGSDASFRLHEGGNSFTQTLPIIGMCSAVASRMLPNFALREISPNISFTAPVPLGATVIFTAKVISPGHVKTTLLLTARLQDCGTEIFKPRTLTMVNIDTLRRRRKKV